MPDVMWQKTADGLWFEVHILRGWYHRYPRKYQFGTLWRDNDLSEDWRYETHLGRRVVMCYWPLSEE